MYWDVATVKVESHLILSVCFSDGLCGRVRFLPQHLIGVFAVLNDPSFFNKVFIEDGVITWPGELDIAPDAIYQKIKKHGECVLS